MFDLGWMEMAMIAVITLMIVGPKDMPKVVKGVTEGIGRLKALSGEFRSGLDDLAREADLDKLQQDIDKVANAASEEMNAIEDMAGDFDYAGVDDNSDSPDYSSYWKPIPAWRNVSPGDAADKWPKHRKAPRKARPRYSGRRTGRDTPGKRKVRS
ncbi:MAG: hypothetical protein F4160_12925 [Rhodospirillaceae bacterium]|nr:hypothetical protein [Rhodospirillaceae bacterium]MYH37684.1 hypothetical protein [Rhodospirillaceae bacterium]MYK14287.1 hypothetical protein [Rhodospirillaceae bacterium]